MSQGDKRWLEKMMSSGTHVDRVSALTIRIKDSPLTSLSAIEQLIRIADGHSRQDSIKTLFTIKDIFANLLLGQFELKTFQDSLRGNSETPGEDELIESYFCHNLKWLFGEFLGLVEKRLGDSLSYVRR